MAIIKRFESKLLKKTQLCDDIIEFVFEAPEDFMFEPGQFVNIKCKAGDETKQRAYSILNAPSKKGTVELGIKIIPGGFAGTFFEKLQEGETVDIMGPLGHFTLQKDLPNKEHWFMAAGIGIIPFISMLNEHLTEFKDHKFILLYGARYKKSLVYFEELIQLEKEHNNFTFIPVVSREDWDGLGGHVQDHLPENLEGKDFYVCGVDKLVIETEEILKEKNIDKKNLIKERYN